VEVALPQSLCCARDIFTTAADADTYALTAEEADGHAGGYRLAVGAHAPAVAGKDTLKAVWQPGERVDCRIFKPD
jgi:hypothetical protein